jgi:signal transduction histidine kinase
MKIVFLSLVQGILLFFTLSNDHKIDSLQDKFKNNMPDTARIRVLNQLVNELYRNNSKLALQYLDQSAPLIKRSKNPLYEAQYYHGYAQAYWAQGNYLKSLQYLNKNLRIYEEQKKEDDLAKTYDFIGINHSELNNKELALKYALLANASAQNSKNKLLLGNITNNLGNIYYGRAMYKEAIFYYQKAEHYYEEAKARKEAIYANHNISNCYVIDKKYAKALAGYESNLKRLHETNDKHITSLTLENIGLVYFNQNKIEKARSYFVQALDSARKYNLLKSQVQAYSDLFRADTTLKNYKLANESLINIRILNDSLYNIEKIKTISELEIKYQAEKKEKENIILLQRQKYTHIFIGLLIALLALFIALWLISFRLSRLLREKNKVLEMQKDEILVQKKLIDTQNRELLNHKKDLEKVVEERTESLKKAKERAEESDRLKTAFMQNISHEIRTPLNAIIGFSDLLLDFDENNKETLIAYKKCITESSNKLIQIITDIIDISKIHTEQALVENEEFDIIRCIRSVYKEFRPQAAKKKLELLTNIDFTTQKIHIVSDEYKIRKVIWHLLDNAVKFTHDGFIQLNAWYIEQTIKIEITDTGIGMDMGTQSTMFNPFRQAELSLNRTYGGNGLGLSLVKAYLGLLNGKITISSQANKGTSIKIEIPV